MAKLRANHNRNKNPFVGMTIRVFLMIAIIAILFYMAYNFFNKVDAGQSAVSQDEAGLFFDDYERKHLYPDATGVEIVDHKYYSLGYAEKYEQAKWVCYVLNRDELKVPNVERHDRFETDNAVSSGSATYYDYRGSGYSRGHLAPAGDMAFSEEAMRESFYMSNMSPQVIPFNGGIWRELEESVRDWAYKDERLYIVTGPVLTDTKERIGKSGVVVPSLFYKAILDIEGSKRKGIAFIMPNEKSEKPIMDFAVTIDELEQVLGFDIFGELIEDDNLEDDLESNIDIDQWPVSQKRFESRLKHWNNN